MKAGLRGNRHRSGPLGFDSEPEDQTGFKSSTGRTLLHPDVDVKKVEAVNRNNRSCNNSLCLLFRVLNSGRRIPSFSPRKRYITCH